MAYELKPPFEIYLNGVEIADAEGHLCTAEGPAEAEAILAALNAFAAPKLVNPTLESAKRFADRNEGDETFY